MTQCYKGGHDFPIEDEYSAYCPEHGVELVWHSPHDPERPAHPLLAAASRQDAGAPVLAP